MAVRGKQRFQKGSGTRGKNSPPGTAWYTLKELFQPSPTAIQCDYGKTPTPLLNRFLFLVFCCFGCGYVAKPHRIDNTWTTFQVAHLLPTLTHNGRQGTTSAFSSFLYKNLPPNPHHRTAGRRSKNGFKPFFFVFGTCVATERIFP